MFKTKLDSIISTFNKMLSKLERYVDSQLKEIEKEQKKASDAMAKQEDIKGDLERAKRIIDKLQEIVK